MYMGVNGVGSVWIVFVPFRVGVTDVSSIGAGQ